MQQIRCIGMTDEEVGRAVEICSQRPSFAQSGYSVTGFADDSEVEELKQAGLLVEVIPDEQLPIAWLEPDADDEAAASGPAPLGADDERPFPQLAAEAEQRDGEAEGAGCRRGDAVAQPPARHRST